MTSATSLFPRSRLLRIRSALSRLGSDVSGNFTMIFAIASPVLLVLITALINYSGAISYRQMLQSAADSAALASTNAMVSGQSVSQAQTIGQNLFQDNVPNFQWARDALNVYPGEFNGTYMTTVTYPGLCSPGWRE